jgi:hypothetical protein
MSTFATTPGDASPAAWGNRARGFANNLIERNRFTRVAGGAMKRYVGSDMFKAGNRFVMDEIGVGKEFNKRYSAAIQKGGASKWLARAGKWGGRGFIGLAALQGFREEGLWGAAKGAAESVVWSHAMGQAFNVLGKGARIVGGGMQAAAIGGGVALAGGLAASWATGVNPIAFAARGQVREHMKKHARVEMGGPVRDQFGTVATMRQRSVQAMQNSKLNGRSAMGSEATYMYRPYFR